MNDFVDFYELLQVNPTAEAATIKRVFHMLAARYHPDNPQTGDGDMFLLIKQAHDTLLDAELRASYDRARQARLSHPMPVFEAPEFVNGIEAEANRRLGLLCLLYNQRRSDPERSGVSVLELETKMAVPREHLEFTCWYLREKNYLRRGDNGDVTITAEGIDYVESKRPANPIVLKLIEAAHDWGTHKSTGATKAN